MDVTKFSPALRGLLAPDRLPPLGPGAPDEALRSKLAALTPDALGAVRDGDAARACLAGLWLLHDFLDESHAISQDLHTAEGSYWHGIMHRREPDYSNAKYWFRRVGRHPVFEPLRAKAAELAGGGFASAWDPFAFIDRCEAGTDDALCRRVQRAEWDLLFEYCYRRALGDA